MAASGNKYLTGFYFVRHGLTDQVGKIISGRGKDIHLNAEGGRQAEFIAAALKSEGILRIISSPLERALETAAPLSRALNVPVETADPLNEVDFGDWTGCLFSRLHADPAWEKWNCYRSISRIPNGESMVEVQARVCQFIFQLEKESSGKQIALFSHGDVIRAALLYFLGMPLDFIHRLEISHGSTSLLSLDPSGPKVCWIGR